ncbi:MAG: winged helix-turn-helix transcriptional regulator [Clostridia bacterium]|nr:winged helix-turn-helix transcriptional regulator [Clostridia bacterium]MBR5265844.1 winged helix-turn-helix transcriptional regulator [Clostridia bacterium]
MDVNLMLKALGDDNRMKIVEILLRHNMCVRSLANKLGITQAAVSQHIRVLREAGLVSGEKRGYFMHYEVDRAALKALANHLTTLAQVKKGGEHSCHSGCKCHENKEEI